MIDFNEFELKNNLVGLDLDCKEILGVFYLNNFIYILIFMFI